MTLLLLFLIPLYSILTSPTSSSTPCSTQHQISLLLRIKSELSYDTTASTKLSIWNSENLNYCAWPGVKCVDNCVIDLDLSSEYIFDGFNSSSALFELTELHKLNLSFNIFNVSVPSSLETLTKLTHLNLSNAGFVGQIPVEVLGLKQLVSLDISTFPYLGTSLLVLESPGLGDLVGNLTRLEELYLDGLDLSSSATTWSHLLANSLPNLKALSVWDCNLLGPDDGHSLAKLEFLSVLRLDGNNLSALDPRVFENLNRLETLSAVLCELKGNFPAKVFTLQTLKTLDLSDNPNLNGYIPPQSFGESCLQTLTLSNTNFSGLIPQSIGELRMLSHLNLGQCSFHGLIPRQLWNSTNLVSIDLSSNRLNGSLESFSKLVKLTALVLSNNLFSGSIISTDWRELVHLEDLDLRNNSLFGEIPTALFCMSSLTKLLLSHNGFDRMENLHSGAVPSPLLSTVDLGSNKLQGPFPTFIFRLQDIKILTIGFNNFSGVLNLGSFQSLRNLSSLDLSFNNLVIEAQEVDLYHFPQLSTLKLAYSSLKKFPDFLKYQSRLNYIDLSGNQIYGMIPKWIMNMRALSHLNLSYNLLEGFEDRNIIARLNTLDLRSNKLQGELPNFPPTASYMDFSKNNFSSELSSEVGGGLLITLFFSLASNYFTGKIPTAFCNASNIQVLDLSNNHFSGDLPRCLVSMSQTLGILNLRNNSITGSISDSFVAHCNLRTFDLSSNLIHGKLPKSLSNCRQLEVLDLGNNKIQDTFPCWLKKVTTLRVLVLRSNMFHGSIGCPDVTKNWETLQIVDVAYNKFKGSLNSGCLKSWKGMMTSTNDAKPTHGHLVFKVFELGQLYYQDTVTVTIKGLQIELGKILTVFSSMDFSSNQLDGEIPDIIGNMTSLLVLNFSHNSFSNHMPATLGNLAQVESLDLSHNQLTGEIPNQLANLTFLSVLNLSYNKLEGMIPSGRQFNTFSEYSFSGNEALCGAPLRNTCRMPPATRTKIPTSNKEKSGSFDWRFILTGVGFGVGSGIVVTPLVFWEKGKAWRDKQVDILLCHILHLFGLSPFIQDEILDDKEEQAESENESEDEGEGDEAGNIFCLYCSKIDITRKKVIHDPKCRCHESPPTSFTSSSSSSSSISFVPH